VILSGGCTFQAYTSRLASYLGASIEQVRNLLPSDHEEWVYWANAPKDQTDDWKGYQGHFKNISEVQTFIAALKDAKAKQLKV
jgi:hypothetical protein